MKKGGIFVGRPGVTYLEVSQAAQEIMASGRIPTIETVRMALGTGSNSTLGNHLRTWKAKQDGAEQIANKENIPHEFIAVLKGLWERLTHHAEDKIQLIQEESLQLLATAKEESKQLQQENASWQQQFKETKQERDALSHEKSTLESLLSAAKIDIATLTEKGLGLEKQSKEKQVRIEELNQQTQQIQANLEHYRAASLEQRLIDQARYEQQHKQFEQTIQQLNQELAKNQHEKSEFQKKNYQLNFENNHSKTQLEKLTVQYESVMTELIDARHTILKKTEAEEHWKAQCHSIETQYNEKTSLFLELEKEQLVLSKQLEFVNEEVKEICEQNKMLAHEKWILGQEKAQLYGQLKQLESTI